MSSNFDQINIDELTKPREHLNYEQLGQLVSLVFKPGGYFSHHFDRYNYREDQERMAQIIAKGISTNRAAIIEAGTGTGKSHGCLVPASLYASICNKRVLVVTHNIALQTQLFAKDLPVVKNVLGSMGLEVNGAIIKGKSNYICTKKLKDAIQKTPAYHQEEMKKLVEHATKDGKFIIGDREQLPYNPPDPFWNTIAVTPDTNCDGCPFKENGCFHKHNSKKAKEANVIISNHFVLISDLNARKKAGYAPNSGTLPDYDVVIVDEAHHLEEVASEILGQKASEDMVFRQLKRVLDLVAPNGPLVNYRQERKDELVRLCTIVRQETSDFFNNVYSALKKAKKYSSLVKEQWVQGEFSNLKKLYLELIFNATHLKEDNPEMYKRFSNVANSLKEIFNLLSDISVLKDERDVCYWAHIEKRKDKSEYAVLVTTPVEINKFLREALFTRMPAILTSATIKFDKDLSFFARKIGRLEEHEYESGFMQSPFDYENQVCFYVPNYGLDCPKSGDIEGMKQYDDYCIEEMYQLVKMSSGRAFLLFTSLKTVNNYYEKLAPLFEKMGYRCFKQGGDLDRNQMVSEFTKHGNAVLFGSLTFWEGISVDGRELSLVVMHKLPFDVPNPVSESRVRIIEENGGDPFLEGHVFSAVTKYKQGFGRLIRHEKDKGVFCVLDARILSNRARYGKYFLQGTPKTALSVSRENLAPYFE